MTTKKEYNLIEAIEAVAQEVAPELDIVTVKIVGPAKGPIVRVYIDHPKGVTFEILCQTQTWVSNILDEINPFSGSYTLEVSSPGLDRPLRKIEHFKNACGNMAKIKTCEAINNRASFTGTIVSVDNNLIKIELDEGKTGEKPTVDIPFIKIESANLKEDYELRR